MTERFPFGPSTRPPPLLCLQGLLDRSSPSRGRFAALRAQPWADRRDDCSREKGGNCGPVGVACTNERFCNDRRLALGQERGQVVSRNQVLCQLRRSHRPEALWARTADMLLCGRRAATEQAFGPLGGNRVPTVYSAKKSPTDSRVGVGVSAAHNRVHHGFLQVLRMGKLPEDVAERRQNPALLVDVVGRGCDSGALDGTKQATIHFPKRRDPR